MKALMFTCGLVFGALALGAGVAHAQTTQATISVPFSFDAGGHSLPSGRYEVQIDVDHPDVVELQGIDHPTARVDVLTIPDYRVEDQARHPELEFVKRNGVMELSEFVDPGWASRQMILNHSER